ncbi:MAG TPA: Tad domain-containing protein [Gaiellaceae bacterium]|nr:Tad domain-containing protein [Gaiellaceae bacterium]
MTVEPPARDLLQREGGQVAVLFGLLLPVIFGLSAIVIAVGNWFTHAKHLQTKADAGAFAGGSAWEFPCGPEIEGRIIAEARTYSGARNPQVGGVPNTSIHTVLNGPDWYDDDSNPFPVEYTTPVGPDPNARICSSMTLDVKVTEDNSFPLASLIPFFPDIKRKARVEIQEAKGISGLLPIAVRAPEPASAAAVFYNEANGNILAVKYFVKQTAMLGLPGGLQGWTTLNGEDPNTLAQFTPPAGAGVAIALSFRGACNTGLPNPNTKIVTSPPPCFEDSGFTTVNQLCNQGSSTQIVNCYYATGTWPSESVRNGLHFIRGYGSGSVTDGPPQVRSAWLENSGDCTQSGAPTTGYFNARPNTTCHARLVVKVDIGDVVEDYPPGPPVTNVQTRVADNVEVRFAVKRGDGSTFCENFGSSCDLLPSSSSATGVVTYSTTGNGSSPFVPLTAGSGVNAIALQIRVRRSSVNPNPGNCGTSLNNYNDNCRWFYVGTGIYSTSVNPVTNNNGLAVLQSPLQRAFRGNSLTAGPVKWLRLTAYAGCGSTPTYIDNEAASMPSSGNHCFHVEMGLKGGLAQDANEEPILFNDGVGPSQMGSVDCDPNIAQGQILTEGVVKGCSPFYAKNGFDTNPLCPTQNTLFNQPNPGPPWDDWPPIECVKTRPTSSMNQIESGFDERFFGNPNANSCPAAGPGYVRGRNYWDKDTLNGYVPPQGSTPLGFKEGTHDTHFAEGDPRIVTIFLVTPEAFLGSGQATYPITGFIQVYVTGYGRIQGNGGLQIDDPCPGSDPPSDLDLSGGSTGGYAVWGHIIKYEIPQPSATPSGVLCNPNSLDPCVAVLVE